MSGQITLDRWLEFADALALYAFGNWALQATLLLSACLLLARLPRPGPCARHRLLLGGLLLSALLPLGLVLPRVPRPARTEVANPRSAAVRPAAGSDRSGNLPVRGNPIRPRIPFPGFALLITWTALQCVGWARLAFGFHTVRRWGRKAVPLDRHRLFEACRYRVADIEVAESEEVPVPMVAGVLRPRILLPRGLAARLSLSELRHVLLHEEAHVRRRDPLWFFAAELARVVLAWHPLAEPVRRALIRAAEDDCDVRVLASGARGPEYVRTLLAVLAQAAPVRPPAATCPLGCPGTELRRRVSHILYGAPAASRAPGVLVGVVSALVAALVLTVEVGDRPLMPIPVRGPVIRSSEVPAAREPRSREEDGEVRTVPPSPPLVRTAETPRVESLGSADLPDTLPARIGEGVPAESRLTSPLESRTVVFLLDTSTSMRPFQFEAREQILQQIEQLAPGDRFNVVAFSSAVSQFAELPVYPGEDSLAGVRAWISGLGEESGSDLEAGLTHALRLPGLTSLVVYTDGNAASGIMDLFGLGELIARENHAHAQIFTVAFGPTLAPGPESLPGALPIPAHGSKVQAEQPRDQELQQ